eukprot:COSAG01_NODE_78347_length_147_cov_72.708333_1_plen_48_part_11
MVSHFGPSESMLPHVQHTARVHSCFPVRLSATGCYAVESTASGVVVYG